MSHALPEIDTAYLRERLLEMLAIPSPTGFTNELSRYVCAELDRLGVDYELTRRGTIIARIEGVEPANNVPQAVRAVAQREAVPVEAAREQPLDAHDEV